MTDPDPLSLTVWQLNLEFPVRAATYTEAKRQAESELNRFVGEDIKDWTVDLRCTPLITHSVTGHVMHWEVTVTAEPTDGMPIERGEPLDAVRAAGIPVPDPIPPQQADAEATG